MRFFGLVLIAVFLVHFVSAEEVELSWHTDEAGALKEAGESGKPLFIFFTADWCQFCHEMEDLTFKEQRAKEYLTKHFVLLKADYDSEKNLVARYGIRGVPGYVMGTPDLKAVEKTQGFMPLDVFMAWTEDAGKKVGPEAIAAAKAEEEKFFEEMKSKFRTGLVTDQYKAISDFYEKCAERDPKAIAFAKEYLEGEIKHNPGRFCRFLENEKLHVRILTTNAFAKIYGAKFLFDPWDLTEENRKRLESFMASEGISTMKEELLEDAPPVPPIGKTAG